MTDKISSDEKIKLRYSDLDFNQNLKPFSLLNFFQDIASDNAEMLGFGYSYIHPRNLMWVLLKYRMEFNEYPSGINTLNLKTTPRGYNKLFAYRNFELSMDNKIIGRASSMWSLVDFTTMKIASIDKVIDSPWFTKHEPIETDLDFKKIPSLTKCDYEKVFEVRYNDIDVNMHANNGNYIVWAFEPLQYNFKAEHKLKTLDMTFKKEIKLGEKLVSKVQMLDEHTSLHLLINEQTQEDLCLLHCEWN